MKGFLILLTAICATTITYGQGEVPRHYKGDTTDNAARDSAAVSRVHPRRFSTAPMPNSYQNNNAVPMPNSYRGDNCVPIPNVYQGPPIKSQRRDSIGRKQPQERLRKPDN